MRVDVHAQELIRHSGQPPHPRTHRSTRPVRLRRQQRVCIVQLDLCLTATRRHIRSQSDSPNDWSHPSDALSEAPLVVVGQHQKHPDS